MLRAKADLYYFYRVGRALEEMQQMPKQAFRDQQQPCPTPKPHRYNIPPNPSHLHLQLPSKTLSRSDLQYNINTAAAVCQAVIPL